MERGEGQVKFARRGFVLNVFFGIFSAMVALYISKNKKLYLSVTAGSYLLTGRDSPDETEHNDLEVWEGRGPEFFELVSASEAVFLLVCSASHTYVHHEMAEKMKLAQLLRPEKCLFRRFLLLSDMGTCSIDNTAGVVLIFNALKLTSAL